jgi:methyl coenzyme M reductase subunit D
MRLTNAAICTSDYKVSTGRMISEKSQVTDYVSYGTIIVHMEVAVHGETHP